ncbi:MAG: hypothetical protein ACOCVN_03345, partial [bacterium]
QLTVNAGNDVIVCVGEDYTNVQLGGCPVASGGVEPYKYTWSGKVKPFSSMDYWVHASDMLDDTTHSNPVLKRNPPTAKWMTLYVKVEDAAGSVGYDSVKIKGSDYAISLNYPKYVTINRGDSVALPGNYIFSSNFTINEYYITPSYGLTDSTNVRGFAKPDTSTLYYLHVINTVGCVSEKINYLRVEVDTTYVSSKVVVKPDIHCKLEQGSLIVHWPFRNDLPYYLTVATLSGQLIHTGKYNEPNLRLSHLGLKSNQLYIITIAGKKERSVFKLFNK